MRFIYALCLLIIFSGHARALDGLVECPDGNEALARVTHTPYGYPLTETFARETGGRAFAVPIGYLRPWPPPKYYRMQPVNSPQGFQFSFWMPDGRMPESDPYWTVMRRPCDAGRAQADEAHYVVDVIYELLPARPPYPGARFDDERVLSVLKNKFDFETQVQISRRGDMIKYRLSNYAFDEILSSSDAPFDAVVKCDKITRAPNVSCRGDIRFHGDDYALFLAIPRDSVKDFEAAAKLAQRLIGEWRQGAVAE